jgi:hypothetical protein
MLLAAIAAVQALLDWRRTQIRATPDQTLLYA